MSNNLRNTMICLSIIAAALVPGGARALAADADTPAQEIIYDQGSIAVLEYQVDGSLFQQIADLEQEKLLMQLEKEKAQLLLDLERLAAEQKKLQMEADAIDSRADEQRTQLEMERQQLIAEQEKLELQRQRMAQQATVSSGADAAAASRQNVQEPSPQTALAQRYRLLNVMGAGNQLQATIEDLATGQRKKISAGKTLDGYDIRSISLDEGVTFARDGDVETLSVGSK